MADKPKKPRKIKDLKARLGRTISPNTPGAKMPEGVPTPKGAGGIVPPKAGGVVPPKGVVRPGGVVAPAGVKRAGPSGPFAPPQPSVPPPSNDPFAAAAPSISPGPQEVRLVLDDSAVDDAEVGKKNRGRNFILIGAGLALGLLMGFGVGSVMNQRKTHNLAVADGRAMHESVTEASTRIDEATRLVNQAVTAAGGGSDGPSVDYEAIETLRAMEAPFPANAFVNRNYFLFDPHTVDQLFRFYNATTAAWAEIEGIANMTAGDERREQLNQAATAAGEANALIGCIPAIADNRLACSLGFVTIEEVDGQPTANVRPRRSARRGINKVVYSGQDLNEEPEQYVILVNNQQSMGVLGEQATLYAQYVQRIGRLKALLDEANAIRGELETSLGQVAANEELFAL